MQLKLVKIKRKGSGKI